MGKIKDLLAQGRIFPYGSGIFPSVADFSSKDLAANKIWITKDMQLVSYETLKDSHIVNILKLFEKGELKAGTSNPHYKALKRELLIRTTKAGKLLYAEKK